jgi:Domain of unknown function (DUF1963)
MGSNSIERLLTSLWIMQSIDRVEDMGAPFPTLLISRRPRHVDVEWTGARSWLGGAPRIGDTPWPRDKKAQPLLFVAQIDLAEVASKTGTSPLPDKGSLAFFIGGGGAVVFVPEGQTSTPIMPPAGTPDLTECGGAAEWRTDLAGRPLFPYWPIDFTALDVTPPASDADEDAWDEFGAAEVAAVKKLFPRRKYSLTAEQAFAGPSVPDWWQTAIYYASYLDKAAMGIPNLIKREQGSLEYARKKVEEARSQGSNELKKAEAYVVICENKIALFHQLQPAFLEFATEVSGFSNGRDPWALMSPDEVAHLGSLWARNSEFAAFHQNQGKFPIDYLKNEMFKALPAADTPAFAAFPAPVRNLLNEKRAPRPQWWFMAIHYAKRLQEAAQLGVPSATKRRVDNIAAYRRRLNELHPKDALAIFRRMTSPKSADVTKLEAEIAQVEAELAKLGQLEVTFKRFVEEVSNWTRGRDPWSLMHAADAEQLDARMKRAREEFRDFAAYYVPHRREELETLTLVTMASADSRAYAALPESVRTLINRDYLLATGGWHQMFGRGVEIQGDSCAMREQGYIMLLQLTHDDLMHWGFGDNGVYQFWMSPADLANRNWTAATMTFEMH